MTPLTGTEQRLLHLLMDLKEGDMESVSMERTVEENRLIKLAKHGLIDVKVTAEGRKALREIYRSKEANDG